MAVMIKTLSQLPVKEEMGTLDAVQDWHEIAVHAYNDEKERYWSSWKTALSAEILYAIYSSTLENTDYGSLSAVGLNGNAAVTAATKASGSTFPGILKTLQLRNKLDSRIDLSAMHDQLTAIVGNETERVNADGSLHLSGAVTAVNNETFKIGTDATSANIQVSAFNSDSGGNIVPNARAVFNFTRDGLPIMMSPYSGFETLYKSESGNKKSYSGRDNAIRKETVPHDAYIFRILNSGTVSNSWITPAAGWFTCFGWLSEISLGQQANYQRWVALEGNINNEEPVENDEDEINKNWCILQLQPFIPSPYIGYVGFGIPVSKGLKLRIRTGFAVGASSGNYAMSNISTRSSMANHIPNAFVGGIYSMM